MKNIIKRLAKEFNKKEVVWAIGGSYLLKRYGIDSKSDVLDIVISEDSIVSVSEIMNTIAVKQEGIESKNYQSDYYEVYLFDGQLVNIVSNLKSNFEIGRAHV